MSHRAKTFTDGKFRYQLINGVRHYNFRNEAEFREFFGENCPELVRDWHDGQEGDWVLADDGGVVQILKRGKLSHPSDYNKYVYHDGWCRTVVGTFFINRKRNKFKMDTNWDDHFSRYTFSGCTAWRKDKTKLTTKEQQFVFAMVYMREPMTPVEIYMKVYKTDNYGMARRKTAFLLRQERIMNELRKEVEEAAKELRLDHKWVLERLKMIAESGEEEKNRLSATKEVAKVLQTYKPKEEKGDPFGGHGLFMGFKREQIEEARYDGREIPEAKLVEASQE